MIRRNWSLLTAPAAILTGIVGTVVVSDLLFVENVLYTFSVYFLVLPHFFLLIESLFSVEFMLDAFRLGFCYFMECFFFFFFGRGVMIYAFLLDRKKEFEYFYLLKTIICFLFTEGLISRIRHFSQFDFWCNFSRDFLILQVY